MGRWAIVQDEVGKGNTWITAKATEATMLPGMKEIASGAQGIIRNANIRELR